MNKKVYKVHTFFPLFINLFVSGTAESDISLLEHSFSWHFTHKLLLTAVLIVPTKAVKDHKITPVGKLLGVMKEIWHLWAQGAVVGLYCMTCLKLL